MTTTDRATSADVDPGDGAPGANPAVRKGARIGGDDRARLAARLRAKYDKGASLRQLADETGRSYGFVHTLLTEAGATLRGRGGSRPRRTPGKR